MLHRLRYSVTFPSTGRTLSNTLDFDRGYTAITGPNEAGKSFVFEMIRFLLFGTAALRGASDDYKTLQASGEFTIRGERYEIERTLRKATLKRAGETVCTGVTPVNDKIVRLLGFGMSVFDTACAINQGEVERLGSMTPAERKRLVDSVVGIDLLDVVGKWAADEARLLDRDAATIRATLSSPTPPDTPPDYVPSDTIDLAAAETEARELSELEGFLAVDRPKPVQPTTKVDLPAENLRQFAEKRKALREEVAGLEAKVKALPTSAMDVEGFEEAWARYDDYEASQRWLKANPAPAPGRLEQLQQWMRDWASLEAWAEFDRQRGQLDQKRIELSCLNHVDCPACKHVFHLDGEKADRLRGEIETLESELCEPDVPRPLQPPMSAQAASREEQEILSYDHATWQLHAVKHPIEAPSLTRQQIMVERTKALQVAQRAELEPQLEAARKQLDQTPDYETMLLEREHYERALVQYREEVAEWEAWSKDRAAKTVRRAALLGAHEKVMGLRDQHARAVAYEAALTAFEAAWARYEAGVADADEKAAKADGYRKIRETMLALRGLVKQHLLPSLNKVASHLLGQMTGGQRNVIVVDEDFDVTVDNQALDTLSGSGKACANLALRIALGQVLTNRVMSLLLADEIDASMDAFRAEQTSNVLKILQKNISQLIHVSHKSIEADHMITLGGLVVDVEPVLDGRAA